MAALGFAKVQGRVFSACCDLVTTYSHTPYGPLLCYQQKRGKRGLLPWKDNPRPWHVKRRGSNHPYNQAMITEENKQFLDSVVKDEYSNQPSPLRDEPWPRNTWTPETVRTGVLGVKIGVLPQWRKDGSKMLCQLIQIIDNHAIRYVPPEKFQASGGFKPWDRTDVGCMVVGALSCPPWNYSKEYHHLFEEAGVPPKRKLTRFMVTPDAAVQPGTPLSVMHFKVGDYVDCSAKTIDYGFQGVMKRWGFSGGPASHGATKFHRRPGSLSAGRERGLWKGTKMPGMMGNDWRIARGLKIWRINTKYNILYVSMGVPGANHSYVRVYDTALQSRREEWAKEPTKTLPMPTFYPGDSEDVVPEDLYDPELYQFTEDSIKFTEDDKS